MNEIKTKIRKELFVEFVCPKCSTPTLREYVRSMELSYQEIKCVQCGSEFTSSIDREHLTQIQKKILDYKK